MRFSLGDAHSGISAHKRASILRQAANHRLYGTHKPWRCFAALGMTRFAGMSLICLAVMSSGCATLRKIGGDSRSAEAAIREADIAWAKAAQSGLEGFMSAYTPDARLLPPNMPMATGSEEIRKALRPLFASPGFALNWQPARVEAARSGEMGYAQGVYQLTMNDAQGKPMTEHGKYLEIWKKQSDGTWKCTVDMFNSDMPPH